jgi:hypothetical protein
LLVNCLRPAMERRLAVIGLDEGRGRRRQDNDTGIVLR